MQRTSKADGVGGIRLQELTPYWWIDHISTILSVPLALVGFGVTLWQLKKTKTSAEAAQRAATEARDQMRRMNIAGLLPQLSRIEDEIDRAVANNSVDVLRYWISNWQWQASEVRGYLQSSSARERKVMRQVQSSMSSITDTRDELHAPSETLDLREATRQLRKDISEVTVLLGEVSSYQLREDGKTQ